MIDNLLIGGIIVAITIASYLLVGGGDYYTDISYTTDTGTRHTDINDFFAPTTTECVTQTEDCLKKAMELSDITKKSSMMIAELYNRVELLLSQLEIEENYDDN
jgi:hypothetical protein